MAEISPLRRRMIEDMTVRNLSPATQQSYLNAVSKFSRYFGRSPDRLGLEDVHAFQVHLVATGISWPALNQIVCALRFFYGVTLGQATVPERIAYAREPSNRARARPSDSDNVHYGTRIEVFAKSIAAPIAAGKESPRVDLSFGARPTPLNTCCRHVARQSAVAALAQAEGRGDCA